MSSATTISLSRLARLVGLPRTRLQLMAQSGELATFDGEVELAEVMRAFPDARFDNDSELKRVEAIKDAALTKSAEHAELPDAEVLRSRLNQLGADFAHSEARLRHYDTVHRWLATRIRTLVADARLAHTDGEELVSWLERELATTPDDTARLQRLISRERLMRVMSAQITVQPRGAVFEAKGNETLLEAGLRSGLSFSYACSNGNCGECKARVLSGDVTKIRPHDYALSSAERASGVTLMCCYAPIGDVTIEAAAAGASDIPEQRIEARVRTVEAMGPDVLALHLLTPRSERLHFLAGQRVKVAFGDTTAELSVASCPCEERRVELHVPRVSRLGQHVGELRQNDAVEIVGPFGGFVLDETSSRPLLLIAEGLGYAPIKSLVQHALSLDQAPAIALHWLAGTGGLYQESLARSYASALDNFTYIAAPAGSDRDAFLAGIAARPDLAACDVFAAGSAAFLASAQQRLGAAGLPSAQWRAEPVETPGA